MVGGSDAGDYRPSILIMARHFPPHVSGGARRPYLLALSLKQLGCEVSVVAPRLPEGIEGLSVPHPHPEPSTGGVRKRAGLRDLARAHLLWPDPDIRWSMRAARAAHAAGLRADWIVTTSPPESLHLAGAWLKQRIGGRWAADFRDEWLARPFHAVRLNPVRRALEMRLARWALKTADLLTAVDDVVGREVRSLTGRYAHHLPQSALPPPEPVALDGTGPHILYTGSFSLSDPRCSIEPTLQAFSAAWLSRPQLRLHLVGRLSETEQAAVETCDAREGILMYGPRSYQEARAFQAAADAFVVTGAPDATAIPGKVYEYRTVGAPIIAIGDGPWRRIGGYADVDAAEAMASLAKNTARTAPSVVCETPLEVAVRLLSLMAEINGNKLS